MPYKPDYYSLISKWKNKPVRVDHSGWLKYLGMAEAEAGNKEGAAAYWNKLLTFLDPATQAHAEVKARLETLNGPGRP